MNFEEYKKEVINEIKARLGDTAEIQNMVCGKNNGTCKDGIAIHRNSAVSPIIYLEGYYERFREGEDFDVQIENIIGLSYTENDEVEELGNMLTNGNWDDFKDKVGVELINMAWNAKRLEEAVYVKFLNLAMVFRIMFDDHTSCVITKRMIKKWGVTTEDVVEAANKKLLETKHSVKSMSELFKSFDLIDGELDEQDIRNCPLYVMTNEHQVFGASSLARTDLLCNFTNSINEDVYIIPSSIHEVLLVPATEDVDVAELKSMVKDVNSSTVSKEEWLSENIYFFGREKNELEVAA